MKKLIIVVLSVLTLTACTLTDSPKMKTEEFLNTYKNLDESVLSDLDMSAEAEGLSVNNTETYKQLIKRQYQDMKHSVESETIDGDEAIVTVKLTVYDLYKASKEAGEYLEENPQEFMEEEVYNENEFIKYKLNKMKSTETTVEYTVEFYLVKTDSGWVIQEPESTVKEKIHGLYDYED